MLSALQKEFADETEISSLLDDAREKQKEHRKQQSISRARELVAGRRYAESAGLLMSLRKEYTYADPCELAEPGGDRFSIIQRKVLTPNDFAKLEAIRYWHYTRS